MRGARYAYQRLYKRRKGKAGEPPNAVWPGGVSETCYRVWCRDCRDKSLDGRGDFYKASH